MARKRRRPDYSKPVKAEPQPRDRAFARLADAVGKYLKTIGWTAVVVGSPAILGEEGPGLSRYQFMVTFTGGRRRPTPKETP